MLMTRDTTVNISVAGGALVALEAEMELLTQEENRVLTELKLIKSKKAACYTALHKIIRELSLTKE